MISLHFQQLLQEQRCKDGEEILKNGWLVRADKWRWKGHDWYKVLVKYYNKFYVILYWDNKIYDVILIGDQIEYILIEYLLAGVMRGEEISNEGNEFLEIPIGQRPSV